MAYDERNGRNFLKNGTGGEMWDDKVVKDGKYTFNMPDIE